MSLWAGPREMGSQRKYGDHDPVFLEFLMVLGRRVGKLYHHPTP